MTCTSVNCRCVALLMRTSVPCISWALDRSFGAETSRWLAQNARRGNSSRPLRLERGMSPSLFTASAQAHKSIVLIAQQISYLFIILRSRDIKAKLKLNEKQSRSLRQSQDIKLDSLCQFFQRRSPTPHFGGADPGCYHPLPWLRSDAMFCRTPSLCLLFVDESAKCHIFGVCTQGAMTPKLELGRDFCAMHLPKFHNPMLTRSEVIMLTNEQTHKQTNRCRWKHSALFTTLRRWINITNVTLQNEQTQTLFNTF